MGSQFGPTATPNPYVAGNTPSWATGAFAMPWWGLDPFGQPLTQEQMMYQAPAPAQQAPTPQSPQLSQEEMEQLIQEQIRRNNQDQYHFAQRGIQSSRDPNPYLGNVPSAGPWSGGGLGIPSDWNYSGG
jgi:hypothetical protein